MDNRFNVCRFLEMQYPSTGYRERVVNARE